MDVTYRFIIYDPLTGDRLGSGPITTGLNWTTRRAINQIGKFSCKFLAADEQARHVTERVGLICEVTIPTVGIVELGRGEIYSKEIEIGDDGRDIISVTGSEDTRRLAERSVGLLDLASRAGEPILFSDAVTRVINATPSTTMDWRFRLHLTSNPPIHFGFSGESIFAALVKLTQLAPDFFFYFEPPNIIVYRSDFEAASVRAIASPPEPDPLDPDTCYIIGRPRIRIDRYDTLTRIRPYGSGQRHEALNIATATVQPPGFIVDRQNNFVAHAQAEADMGRIIEKAQKYGEVSLILPKEYRDLDEDVPEELARRQEMEAIARREAANELVNLAVNELERSIHPSIYFDLSLLHCNQVIRPGQKIRCIFSYQLSGEWVKVDQWLNVVGTRLQVDRNGLRTTNLTVGEVKRPPRDDSDPLVRLYKDMARI